MRRVIRRGSRAPLLAWLLAVVGSFAQLPIHTPVAEACQVCVFDEESWPSCVTLPMDGWVVCELELRCHPNCFWTCRFEDFCFYG